jgi:hypothetical protein
MDVYPLLSSARIPSEPNGLLVHDLNIGGSHEIVKSDLKGGAHRLGVRVERLVRIEPPAQGIAHGRAVEFCGKLLQVTVAMHGDQKLDGEGVGNAEMARQ